MMTPSEAAVVQRTVAQSFDDPIGVRNPSELEWVLARPFARQNGIPAYPTFFSQVSAMVQGVLEKRPFAGANRRTALCMLVLLLQQKGYRLRLSGDEFERLVTGVELGFTTTHRIAVWLKSHTVREARRP